jgi:vacuolar-type H+-ATPase subunit E/Vma4
MYQTNIKENKQIEKKLEIQLARNRIISTVLYADSRQVISESEEVLQIQHTS